MAISFPTRRSQQVSCGRTIPLIIETEDQEISLALFARNNLEIIQTEISRIGGILFRGFDADSPQKLEDFARILCPNLFADNGEHPRQNVTGNVYTPVSYPSDKKILWHNENSFNYSWPQRVWFCSLTPAAQGGETPIVDSRDLLKYLDPRIKSDFIKRQVMYVRNYGGGLGLDWRTVFRTSNRAEVESECRRARIDLEWKQGDRLVTRSVRPAVIRHPVSGDLAWFNQAQHWHPSCLDSVTRESIASLFKEEDYPRHCYYGDGREIEDTVMNEILSVYQDLEVAFRWEERDVLMLDNILMAHGRNPFIGERRHLVAMGDMLTYDDVPHAVVEDV